MNFKKSQNIDGNFNTFNFSVRDFVSYVHRKGSINNSFVLESDINASTLHSRFIDAYFKNNYDSNIFSEYTLKEKFEFDNFTFNISGRADIIKVPNDDITEIIEIKGLFGKALNFPEKADPLHLAQAKFYAFMYSLENNITESIKVTICYVNSSDFKAKYYSTIYEISNLKEFIDSSFESFLDIFKDIGSYKRLRNDSISKLKFPYDNIRDGQKDFMQYTLDAIKKKSAFLISAPTGIGKTISALYPAIKAIPHNFSDYVFYLTAKNSTQEVANSAIADMRKQGLVIKNIQITAKERICLHKDIYCDTGICPMAINYFDNSNKALKELLKFDFINAEIIQGIATKFNVCPFEISLDISLFCDLIVCDYNYFFDPRVSLDRFLGNEINRYTILVDEAHNLPARSNDMYSADIEFLNISLIFNNKHMMTKQTADSLESIYSYFSNLKNIFETDTNKPYFFDSSIQSNDFFVFNNSCASRKIPKYLTKLILEFLLCAKDELDRLESGDFKNKFKSLYFDLKFFLKVSTEFFNDSYILYIQKIKNNFVLSLKCLNANKMIAKINKSNMGIIFFSATLKPEEYFKKLLLDTTENGTLDYIELPSPFPRENLLVGTITDLSLKYNDRLSTLSEIKDRIILAISCKKGNYIIFCPSFQYMELLSSEVVNTFYGEDAHNAEFIKQERVMSHKQRESFLNKFKKERDKSLVAFAVMGGIFSEGIDLVGENLSGVIIIGVGIPTKNTYQDIVKDYYDAVFGKGYDFAYKFPGFNKVLQAAGRVIRTDSDRGFILLFDKRYALPDYINLFPEHWDSIDLSEKSVMETELKNFFKR